MHVPKGDIPRAKGFNEAAGIHRRKLRVRWRLMPRVRRFNEAAGIHRRKLLGVGSRID